MLAWLRTKIDYTSLNTRSVRASPHGPIVLSGRSARNRVWFPSGFNSLATAAELFHPGRAHVGLIEGALVDSPREDPVESRGQVLIVVEHVVVRAVADGSGGVFRQALGTGRVRRCAQRAHVVAASLEVQASLAKGLLARKKQSTKNLGSTLLAEVMRVVTILPRYYRDTVVILVMLLRYSTTLSRHYHDGVITAWRS